MWTEIQSLVNGFVELGTTVSQFIAAYVDVDY
jgi:hypothetical protein